MKILLTGGGSGGHFYPLIAVAEEIKRITEEERIIAPQLYFMSETPYDRKMLFDNDIIFKKAPAGKLRRYFSLKNVLDWFKMLWGMGRAIFSAFWIYPDVVFSKGGYASFPAVIAAHLLHIPLVIHESDSVPGRANRYAGKFAQKIAVSFSQAAEYFPKVKVAWTGNPVRKSVRSVTSDGAHELLGFTKDVPTIFILGGSQGAVLINNAILDSLSTLVAEYQIIHQSGANNFKEVSDISEVSLKNNPHKGRYRAFDYLGDEELKAAAGAADLIISRAGSTIFEIALWEKPSIIIPITDSNGDHQRKNAIAYEKSGACLVIEESNLKPHILVSEIKRIIGDQELRKKMSVGARAFAKPDAAEIIARAILTIGLTHEV